MHMKERATYRCKSKRCGCLSSTRLPGTRSAVIAKQDDPATDCTEKSEASSQKVSSHRSHDGASRRSPKRRVCASRKRPQLIKRHGSCSNLLSETLLSVAAKLDKVFNSSEAPHHKVKRVYVIRFDDKNSNPKNPRKKFTRVLFEKKSGKENAAHMNRATSRSPNRARCRSTASDEGSGPVSTNYDRSGDAPDTSADHSLDGDEEDTEKKFAEIRNNKIWDKLQTELVHSRMNPNVNQSWETCFDKTGYKVASQGRAHKSSKIDEIADIFGAILNQIENLSPPKGDEGSSPRKKTLSEIIESDQSLVSAEYTIPPSMINKQAVDVLQALIDHKRKPRQRIRDGRKSSGSSRRLGSSQRPFSRTEWYGLRQPLNYQAEIISELDVNMAASSSAGSGPICRICHERLGNLVRPCSCRGSMAYVHVECLQMWLTEKEIDYCELCHYKFRVIHVPEYRLVPSIGFWYKFAATHQQRKRILVDLTLAVAFLPVLIFVTLFARSCSTEYPPVDIEDDMEYEDNWVDLGWLLLVYAFKFLTFLLNMLYVGAAFLRINHHLAAWLSWYVNKNVTIVLEERHPESGRSSGTGDDARRTTSE